uniref:Uncharacterized protein n=1 Tax=Anguilla anguilla TaxID=7936 RepID=A0A0E9U8P2_ANGAN
MLWYVIHSVNFHTISCFYSLVFHPDLEKQ